jgi:hypothetical protein
MTSMSFSRRLAAAFLVLGLAACSLAAQASPAPAHGPVTEAQEKHALMLAIFGDDYDAEAGQALATVKVEDDDNYFLMKLSSAAELPDGTTVVAVNGHPSNEYGGDSAAHASPGMLNLYVLRPVGGGWKLIARHENVASAGSWGESGGVNWVELGAGKPGFILVSGWSGQGYSNEEANVFELGDEVRELGGFATASDNTAACMPDTKDCWAVDSRIRFADNPQGGAYRDILVDFEGRHYTLTEAGDGDPVEHLKTRVQQTARYHFDGKKYVLVSGTNPVPDI